MTRVEAMENQKPVFIVAADVLTKMVEGEPEAKKLLQSIAQKNADAVSPISGLLIALRDCKKADVGCLHIIAKEVKFVIVPQAHIGRQEGG